MNLPAPRGGEADPTANKIGLLEEIKFIPLSSMPRIALKLARGISVCRGYQRPRFRVSCPKGKPAGTVKKWDKPANCRKQNRQHPVFDRRKEFQKVYPFLIPSLSFCFRFR
jgi:hypothetical protein